MKTEDLGHKCDRKFLASLPSHSFFYKGALQLVKCQLWRSLKAYWHSRIIFFASAECWWPQINLMFYFIRLGYMWMPFVKISGDYVGTGWHGVTTHFSIFVSILVKSWELAVFTESCCDWWISKGKWRALHCSWKGIIYFAYNVEKSQE